MEQGSWCRVTCQICPPHALRARGCELRHSQPLRTERRVFHRHTTKKKKKPEQKSASSPSPPLRLRPLNQPNPSTITPDLSLVWVFPTINQSDPCHPSVRIITASSCLTFFFTLLLLSSPPLSCDSTSPLYYTELRQTSLNYI